MARLRQNGPVAQTIAREMAADAIDRIGFVRGDFGRALVIGDTTGRLSHDLAARGTQVTRADPAPGLADMHLDEERPLPGGPYDLIVSLGLLDTVNDLPGALILMRRALHAGGLMIGSFLGAGSLPVLREAMAAADADRPAPRIHPQVDVRAAGQLMNRLGFESPVVDGWHFEVAFDSLDQLVGDLRAQAAGNVLRNAGPPLGKAALLRARDAFAEHADDSGKIHERFEIVTLSGWSAAPQGGPRSIPPQ
ncbi:bifunctional 2-polyprenyl-6-hydroxyphenol methylase/3-demethylubiquinol 3-O-methyltransferase UbiG [Croceicoccus sp. YJ47]|uniref:class I SAM-dependent methyltransferase n=1 Tax=Croceicoccus sp. YJ47 TaxID=2798724 RepID=UPI001F40059B|nr:methyltransferase domain-containing protein [Croceicoccus sp. YJ47]